MSSKNNDSVNTWGRQYFDAPKEKELVNSHMVRSKFANRSINTTTGRDFTPRPMSSRETGLYGRNKSITDDKGNLRLRGDRGQFGDWEKRWQITPSPPRCCPRHSSSTMMAAKLVFALCRRIQTASTCYSSTKERATEARRFRPTLLSSAKPSCCQCCSSQRTCRTLF